MSKTLTKHQAQIKKIRRLKSKSLRQLLVYRFLNHYGYDKGEVTARAIVDDILALVEEFFLVSSLDEDLHHLHYGQLAYMAIPIEERPRRCRPLADTRMKPVVLSFLTESDIDHIAHGFDSVSLRKKRLLRFVDEAFDQGALLSQLDLAILLGVCDAVISKYVCEIQSTGTLLPTRGNVHDLSGAITHKREIITLYLEGLLTPEIATRTNHSKEAVDRYIADYHRVEILWKHGITTLEEISRLSRLSKRVVQQYLDLLPEKLLRRKTGTPKNHDQQTAKPNCYPST